MLTTAFDAAGHERDRDQGCLVVAGFLATANQWIEFDAEWSGRLVRDGLAYFRMSEFAQQVGQFSNRTEWTEARRRSLLSDLIDITQHYAWRKFGCAVVLSTLSQMQHDLL